MVYFWSCLCFELRYLNYFIKGGGLMKVLKIVLMKGWLEKDVVVFLEKVGIDCFFMIDKKCKLIFYSSI